MTPPNSRDLREKLLHKLRGGDRRYAHLNATTAKSRQKIDFTHLNLIKDGLADEFLSSLLNSEKFVFRIPLKDINKRLLEYTNRKKDIPGDDKVRLLQQLQKLSVTKRGLEFLSAHQKEEFSEFGTKSLAFGYPMLLKQVGGEKDDVICAPLFLWYLDVERDYRTDSLVLSRNEDTPIVFNEMLDYYLESELKLDFTDTVSAINARIFDDGLLDKGELSESTDDITSKLSSNFLKSNLDSLEGAPQDRKAVQKLLEVNNVTEMILNAGIFGVFRSGKQSIINDLKNLIEIDKAGAIENEDFDMEPEYPFAVINTDPTQERVLESLTSHQNLIIQGPPGTGKSQTLTALITNALANNQRTLVVCEKRTAMEIIKRNLEDSGLEEYVALIENVNQDRGTIVDRARLINESKNVPHYSVRAEFGSARSIYQNSASRITEHHSSIAALTKQYGDKGIYGQNDNKFFLGKYLKLRKDVDDEDWKKCEGEFYKIPFAFNSIELDTLVSELAEVKDKSQSVKSQLSLVPITDITRTNYQQDSEVIESYFKDIKSKIKKSQVDAQKLIDTEAKHIREDLAKHLKEMQTLANEGIQLLSVTSKNFDWQVLSKQVAKSTFASAPGYVSAKNIITTLDNCGDEIKRCIEKRNS